MSVIQEYVLADCIRELVRFVDRQTSGGAEDAHAPAFSYLLTPKQCDDVDRVCDENGWLRLNCYAVMHDPGEIRHVLDARKQKDGLMCSEIEELLAKAYSPRSLMRCNPPGGSDAAPRRSEQQSVMLNAHQKLYIRGTPYYATAVLEIRVSGLGTPRHMRLSPIRGKDEPCPCPSAGKSSMQSKIQVTLYGALGSSPALQVPGLEGPVVAIQEATLRQLVSDLYTARSMLNPEQLGEARQELDRVVERWVDIHETLLLDVEVHGSR